MLASSAALAQERVEQARNEQAQNLQFRTGASVQESRLTSDAEQVPSTPGDPDLGEQVILKRRDKKTPFRFVVDLTGFYTSNAALTDKRAAEDLFLVAQAALSYQTQIATDFYAEVTIREASFRYAKLDELDFESLNAGAGLTYICRPLWELALSARYNFNRLTDGSQHNEFFKNHTLTLGAQKTFELSKAHYVYAGYASTLGWSEPVAPQRNEHGFYLGYHANLTRTLSADVNYRVAYFDYLHNRGDWNQNVAVSLKWEATQWLNVSASASLGMNDSNRDPFDYQVFSGGVGITASLSF